MITALDVQYHTTEPRAVAAAVVFQRWADAAPVAEYSCIVENIQPYIPGQFFRRELPCLLAVLGKIKEPISIIIVDSYVQLDDKPGLGQHLFEHLNQTIPVVGVAKTSFHGAHGTQVLRGNSVSPLFVTTAGYDVAEAVNHVRDMHGPHRIPTLLKRVDQLARGR